MQVIRELRRLKYLNLCLVGIQNVNLVVRADPDCLDLRGKSDSLLSVIASAEHKQQVALVVVLVYVTVRRCHEHVVMVSHRHRRGNILVGVALDHVDSGNIQPFQCVLLLASCDCVNQSLFVDRHIVRR